MNKKTIISNKVILIEFENKFKELFVVRVVLITFVIELQLSVEQHVTKLFEKVPLVQDVAHDNTVESAPELKSLDALKDKFLNERF